MHLRPPSPSLRRVFIAIALPALGVVCVGRIARAQDASSPPRDAAKHFDRAVALYAEADYQGALVEFKRAYATAPNPTVLYNIGETEYQLQDYAGALAAFARYLSDAPAGAAHRADVEGSLEVLRTRIAHLTVTTTPPGADVTVDDAAAGKTPLPDRLTVSVGHRKVTATLPGHAPIVRYVDVAAGDDAVVTMVIDDAAPAAAPVPSLATPVAPAPAPHSGGTLRTIGWITTAMLAAGATGAGALALKASSNLQNARNTYPVSPATLQADADLTRTYSILADSLTIGAVVLGSITLVSTLLSGGAPKGPHAEPHTGLRVSPTSLDLEGAF
jgi:tetratricopeptide (TPR) repeat protein